MPRPLSAVLCHAAPCRCRSVPRCAVLDCAVPCRAAQHRTVLLLSSFRNKEPEGPRAWPQGRAQRAPQPTPTHGLTAPGILPPHPHPATLRPRLRAPTSLMGRGWMRCGPSGTEGSTCPCPPPRLNAPPSGTHRVPGPPQDTGLPRSFPAGWDPGAQPRKPRAAPAATPRGSHRAPPVSRVRAPRDPTATAGGERSAAPGLWAQLRGAAVLCGAVRCGRSVGSPGVGSPVRAGLGPCWDPLWDPLRVF